MDEFLNDTSITNLSTPKTKLEILRFVCERHLSISDKYFNNKKVFILYNIPLPYHATMISVPKTHKLSDKCLKKVVLKANYTENK